MPPPAIKTLRDLIFWQYAKIIAESAGMGKKNWGFVMKKFKQLQDGEIFWNDIREYIKEREKKDECIFCGKKTSLTIDHILPRSYGGPDHEKNVIFVCKECNSAKGPRRLYEFWVSKKGLENAKYEVPRIAEGKYLKFAYEVLKEKGLLSLDIEEIKKQFCQECDVRTLCVREKSVGKLSPLCLDGILTLCLKGEINAQ
ncbi:MAG: HNH endonuclease [Candidatus Methanomethyliaceae archaeon]